MDDRPTEKILYEYDHKEMSAVPAVQLCTLAHTNALVVLATDPSTSVHSHPHRSAPPSQSEPGKAVATHQTHHGHCDQTSPKQLRLRRLLQPNWRRARGARASDNIAILLTEPASRPIVAPRLVRRSGHRTTGSSPTTEVTARAHIARARAWIW